MIVWAELVQPLPWVWLINEWQIELSGGCGLCQCQEDGRKKKQTHVEGLHVPLVYVQCVLPFKLIWDVVLLQNVVNLLGNPERQILSLTPLAGKVF